MNVIEYVTEEVSRQGHDVTALDGIERVGWMLDAWSYALVRSRSIPTVGDAVELGKRVEPHKNKKGIRNCRVRVGDRQCPDPRDVPSLLFDAWGRLERLTPIEFYKEFELIHPFEDGNGRTGKCILAWLQGRLLDPEFPPADLFGHPIRNP